MLTFNLAQRMSLGLLFVVSVAAQSQEAPTTVNKPTITYMRSLKAVVLFGGYPQRGTPLHETWVLKNGCWQKLEIEAPPPRAGHGAAYDARRKKLVIFGGASGTGPLGDTWEFDGQRWSKASDEGPPARALTRMVFDQRRGRVVLVGGRDGRPPGKIFDDAWEWDGKTWKQLPASGLPARFEHAAAYDKRSKSVVVFGGNQATQGDFDKQSLGDTWLFSANKWTQLEGAGPGKRDHHAMAYHDARGLTVLFGGAAGRTFFGDTWALRGRNWQKLDDANSPPARGGVPAMTYDSDRKKVMMYGGWGQAGPLRDVWEWDGKWQQVELGCRKSQ